jgi:DNA-binding transcriptional regulator YhcF (GntR family)
VTADRWYLVRYEASHLAIDASNKLLTVLSRSDNIKMFSAAASSDGLKISLSIINKLDIPKKRYYRALKQLKDAGLIEKNHKKGSYTHTTFGSIIYQIILEMGQYAKYLEKMQMIDTIKRADKFSEAAILKMIQEITDSVAKSSSFSFTTVVVSQSISNVNVILSFDDTIQILLDQIERCENEILILTRICPEIVINKLLEKSKLGVKVKVVADTDLVKEYFRSQEKFINNLNKKDPIKERKQVVTNPWYPTNNNIQRRIADIPFGMMIFDNSEVGIELVNSNNPNEFYGGILIKDEKIATTMTELYQQIWEKASENVDVSSSTSPA